MTHGKIILLNGASSAGKTSIVQALQPILDEAYLEAGIDKFLFMLPTDYLMNAHLWHQVIGYEKLITATCCLKSAGMVTN